MIGDLIIFYFIVVAVIIIIEFLTVDYKSKIEEIVGFAVAWPYFAYLAARNTIRKYK
jgi:hypothetical protein